ncbi:alcohol dehydrogenase catalytic domain-containing protein [Phototrophicus methaneseepsis]|uniref:Alcohol dehydrogenase catalytic domain-containing protein n=1 Tax=Phototrophicus methaneseepsis TaxID=2710758 RepID=A0A7S8E953_9CHLR|nr:alcohol dehydrogenase catalytic domain-containing protein [Phototrophicus methaneseepsis]QPC82622.1 alcohol dehydrogenase catalytic domain-containing protein [Phototrophicus methaneseepsis]
MKQAVMTEPGKISFYDVAQPALADHDVLMQTKRIGVCGSDIHVYHGMHPYTSYPVVQGHEVGGVVVAVGKAVTKVKEGDKITFMPQVTCGECYPCQHGMYHICESLKVMGFQTGGAAQEYFAMPEWHVIKLPETMSLDQAAMIEPISVAVHAIARGGDVAGKRVLVLGAGAIGNLTAQVAKASGAQAVMITDISPYKLEKARQCGIDCTVNTAEENLAEAILQHFGPAKADLILECVGVEPTMTQAVEVARKGTTIVVVGVFGQKPQVDLGLVQDRELSLVGTLMYQQADYERALELVAEGKMHLDEMITHRFAFEDYLDAYHAIEDSNGHYLKVMIELD